MDNTRNASGKRNQGSKNTIQEKFQEAERVYYNANIKKAAEEFKEIVVQDPDCADAWHYLGDCALQNSEVLDAEKYLDKALEKKSSDERIWASKGNVCQRRQLGPVI